jgi:hypothetical protein
MREGMMVLMSVLMGLFCSVVEASDAVPSATVRPSGITSIRLVEGLKPVSVFDGANGKPIGELRSKAVEHGAVTQMVWVQTDKKEVPIDLEKGTMETRYEQRSVQYTRDQDGFVQLALSGPSHGFWVRKTDLGDRGAQNWAHYISGLKDVLWREDLDGTRLHARPDDTSPVQVLPEGFYSPNPTGVVHGDWMEVKIQAYDDHFQCGGEGKPTGKPWTGWVRGATPDGKPQIWHHTRGC